MRSLFDKTPGSWGTIPVLAEIGATRWKTSIFPEKNSTKFVLPLKADVRKREKITVDQKIRASITIQF
ncbi:PF08922 domain protein [Leptospira alstonii serovar Pingchang str. 80-412]|uniref:PF08922 domain protein n=2 Tax=Leptospira alstonii TaxID=28452 RepID=M6D1S9_9LEPT|nr:PF08922 domain protein [Leptospira alstonii serovar Sichuan str. 79601]EQA81024.1 PF08922 domain protein [Leptospira alstonii serovar Pingchang str. 80-412]